MGIKYKIQLSETSKEDIDIIYNYIKEDSLYYAIKTKNEIENRILILKDRPYIGRKLEGFSNINVRELIYKSYKIIYSIDSNKVFIRRVLHSARLLSKNLIEI